MMGTKFIIGTVEPANPANLIKVTSEIVNMIKHLNKVGRTRYALFPYYSMETSLNSLMVL